MSYDEKLCEEKHKSIIERLEVQDRRLNNHSERLDKLEQSQSEFKVEIKNLCNKVNDLVTTLRWGIGLMIPTLMALLGLLFKK